MWENDGAYPCIVCDGGKGVHIRTKTGSKPYRHKYSDQIISFDPSLDEYWTTGSKPWRHGFWAEVLERIGAEPSDRMKVSARKKYKRILATTNGGEQLNEKQKAARERTLKLNRERRKKWNAERKKNPDN